MNKSCNVALLVFTGILLLAGCTKEISNSTDSSISQIVSGDASTVASTCKIRRIYQPDGIGGRVSALFSYNKAGNPFSVIYSNGGTGVNNHYFFYDTKNRLTEWQLLWGGYHHEQHFYTHDVNDLIVKDSAIYRDCCGQSEYETISTITYDAKRRVIGETIVNTRNTDGPLGKTRHPTYTYDARGNLGVIGWKSSSYDYKINPLRQNEVLQFVMRNYSMNNAAVQAKYNSLGLPLSMNPSNDLFFNGDVTLQIIYDCP
jgi:hypothetical protein